MVNTMQNFESFGTRKSFAGYDILDIIGSGSFSVVYKVRNQETNQIFAAKCLKQFFNKKKDLLKCNEICAMKQIETHPNIISLVDLVCEQSPARVMIIMPLMDINLCEYLRHKKHKPSEHMVRRLLQQLVCGVYYIHSKGLFHRDLKPENILLQLGPIGGFESKPIEKIKICDLGTCISIYSPLPHDEYVSTRWYRSPECLLNGGYYGPKMDIWALGCIFYEMMTTQPLFPGEDHLDQLNCIHKILGTPSLQDLQKFNQFRNSETIGIEFPVYRKEEFKTMLPSLSENGLVILKDMLQYLPEQRLNAKKLYEHYYFLGSNAKKPLLTKVHNQNSIKPCQIIKYRKEVSDLKSIHLREKLWGMSDGRSKNILLKQLNKKS